MFPEKPKRSHRHVRQNTIRLALAFLLSASLLLAFVPRASGEQLTDFIAITVMIPSAVYLVYRAVLGLIAIYYEDESSL